MLTKWNISLNSRRSHYDGTAGSNSRRGAITVLAAFLMTIVFAFLSFTVDLGYIVLTKAQLQNAVDSAALAAAGELEAEYRGITDRGWELAEEEARQTAVRLAGFNGNAGQDSTNVDPYRDIRFGRRTWDAHTNSWLVHWDIRPANYVEVTARRSAEDDNALPLFFAPLMNIRQTEVSATAGVQIKATNDIKWNSQNPQNIMLLPFTIHVDEWDRIVAGSGPDNFSCVNGNVAQQSDGTCEVNLFPNRNLPPGNRGTVNIGAPNNSTSDLRRQIEFGLNESDMSWHNGELSLEDGPLDLTGDPGVSASIEQSLDQIVGEVRIIPLFRTVSGNGANATYEIVRFAGLQILEVNLRGPMNQKRLIVQPTAIRLPSGSPSNDQFRQDSLILAPQIVH